MDPYTQQTFQQLGIALVLGLLVGLQRQHVDTPLAGLRTFPLVTVLGAIAALLDRQHAAGGWILAAALLGLVTLTGIMAAFLARRNPDDLGLTTEIALLLMFATGAYLVLGSTIVAVAVGGGVAVLLQFKPELHGLAARLGDEDLRGIMQFVLISCVVLPVLPDQNFGPPQALDPDGSLAVFNPHETWWMVVLIVGISLAGYIVYKFFGARAGIVLGGILGGAISSTATTVSYARRSSGHSSAALPAALIIAIASTVVFARVLIEIAVVAPRSFAALAMPIAILLASGIVAAAAGWFLSSRERDELPNLGNPTQLRSALVFAAMYALVQFLLAGAKKYFGFEWLYGIAVLSGLTDMDAITLSTARLVEKGAERGGLPAETGWRLIVVASLSNLVFKAGMVAALGSRRLFSLVCMLFAVPVLVGLVLVFAWDWLETLGR